MDSGGDLDDIIRTGFYVTASADLNNPADSFGIVINVEQTADRQLQIYAGTVPSADTAFFWRTKTSGGWADWKAISHSGATAGAFGMPALCKNVSGSTINTDDTVTASGNLKFSDSAGTVGSTPNGTWTCCSITANNAVGLFIRQVA